MCTNNLGIIFFFPGQFIQLLQPTLHFLRKPGSMLTSLVLGHIVGRDVISGKGKQRDAPFCIYLTWIRLFFLFNQRYTIDRNTWVPDFFTHCRTKPLVFPQMVGLWSSSSVYPSIKPSILVKNMVWYQFSSLLDWQCYLFQEDLNHYTIYIIC